MKIYSEEKCSQQNTDEMKKIREQLHESVRGLVKKECKLQNYINEIKDDIIIAFLAKYEVEPEDLVIAEQHIPGEGTKIWLQLKTPEIKSKELEYQYRRLFQKEREESLCEKIKLFFSKWRK